MNREKGNSIRDWIHALATWAGLARDQRFIETDESIDEELYGASPLGEASAPFPHSFAQGSVTQCDGQLIGKRIRISRVHERSRLTVPNELRRSTNPRSDHAPTPHHRFRSDETEGFETEGRDDLDPRRARESVQFLR
jgi:hypothetical protein